MTDRDLITEGRAKLAASTPAPWFVAIPNLANPADVLAVEHGPVCAIGSREGGDDDVSALADAELIAYMRNNFGPLLDELEQARNRIPKLEDAHQRWHEGLQRSKASHNRRVDGLRARIVELDSDLRDERASAGRMQDQLRAACAEGADARDRVAELERRLDRVTDLFETWAGEENEHRLLGFLGIAEGLHAAIEGLREAVHG